MPWETKTRVKKHLSHTPFPGLASLFLSQLLHLLPCEQHWQDREWGLGSTVVCCSFLLIYFACSNVSFAYRQQSFKKCPTAPARDTPSSPGEKAFLLWSLPEAAEEYLLQCLEHFLLLLVWPWCPQGSFSCTSPHSSLPYTIFPFLKGVYPEVPSPWLGAVGLSCTLQWVCWSCVELAVSSMGQLQQTLSQRPSLQPPTTNTWTQYKQQLKWTSSPSLLKSKNTIYNRKQIK